MRKMIIAGGSGFIGTALAHHFAQSFEVVILSRRPAAPANGIRTVIWDGRTVSDWANEIDGCEVLINLNGKNVNCRYTDKNKEEILSSRVEATMVLGEAVSASNNPPSLWIQFTSATIYRDSYDKAMDEITGETGDDFSMNVCKEWEKTFNGLNLAETRKVIFRTSIVMGTTGGALVPLLNLVKLGAGGKQGTGRQMVSWTHIDDVILAVQWAISNKQARGVYNLTAPAPVPNSKLMSTLRRKLHRPLGLAMPAWLLEAGAIMIGTETELVLKSRWVVPQRLLSEGFRFRFADIDLALENLTRDANHSS